MWRKILRMRGLSVICHMEKNDDSHPRAHANIGRDMMGLWHKSTSYIDHNRGGCSAEQLVIDVPLLEKEKKKEIWRKKK